jgi:hypothetical protein
MGCVVGPRALIPRPTTVDGRTVGERAPGVELQSKVEKGDGPLGTNLLVTCLVSTATRQLPPTGSPVIVLQISVRLSSKKKIDMEPRRRPQRAVPLSPVVVDGRDVGCWDWSGGCCFEDVSGCATASG